MKYELIDTCTESAVIKVIGVGGGGGNAVSQMVNSHIEGVEFICANTDAQALRKLNMGTIIQLGVELTKGLGAGTNPEIGRQAAEENRDRIKEVLDGADMVFLTAGMGGGTGTGAIPVIASIAREMGILTVAVVTKPFLFEGRKKQALAEQGIAELEKYVDSLITIP
ncbi:MAG: cell division protein FtsZ, partial [Methylococcaceae bacterium]|nr:cell division protein FtsZ [Methylococcaceae bacterium]